MLQKIAALQLPSQPASLSRLDYYLKIAKDKNVSAVVLGEYVLQAFFKSLIKMPKAKIVQDASLRKAELLALAKKHQLHIIAPMIMPFKQKLSKGIAHFSPDDKFKLTPQNIFISYKSHWDEEGFFGTHNSRFALPFLSFSGLKVGFLSGYEAHFDECWSWLSKKGAHAVVVTCANTFASNERWEMLLRMRAFTHGVALLRVNCVGEFIDDDKSKWEFYGDSMLIAPDSSVIWRLGNGEEMGIATLDKKEILKVRRQWRFALQAKQRGWL